jgi:phosphoribosylformylglycinamidine synthase
MHTLTNLPPVSRIEVTPRDSLVPDIQGKSLLSQIKSLGIDSVKKVRVVKIFKLQGITSPKVLSDLADTLLVEKLWQDFSLNRPLFEISNGTRIIEIAKKPGVMDPEALTIKAAAKDLKANGIKAVGTGTKYIFFGYPSDEELKLIKKNLLINHTIEQEIIDPETTLLVKSWPAKAGTIPIRGMDQLELMDLSHNRLWLDLREMKTIQSFFKKERRDPTDVEIETLAQTWSEHCGHKTFKAKLVIDGQAKTPLISRIMRVTKKVDSDRCLSVFEDNAGVIEFNRDYAICGKVETHNSPSAIEPYGGAATGSGGVFRDIMGTGQGARVIMSTDIFCFAPLDTPPKDIPEGCLHPQRLCQEVVRGVRDYGNRMGIPTANGSLHFDLDWRAKPTIIVGAYGIMPKKYAKKGQPRPGDLILTVGGRTGRDGLHGATFSSGSMTPDTQTVSSQAVQIGNAIEEKRMFDAILKVRDLRLIRAITDCGGGGYSSAVGEIAEHTGCEIHLNKVPLKYPGLSGWEIWLSESQERMIVAIDPQHKQKVLEIFTRYNVEATQIGRFTDTKRLVIYQGKELVCDLPMVFVHDGLPQRKLTGTTPQRNLTDPQLKEPSDYRLILKALLASWDISSKEPIVRQYDHEVQGGMIVKPFTGVDQDAPNNAAVTQPLLDSGKGVAVAHGMNPVYNQIDPYHGSASAVDEAVRNLVTVGVDPEDIALIDNFIWPTPDEASLADLDRSVDGCCDTALAFNLPFVSGKDSLSSTYTSDKETIKIPPTLCISAFAPIKDTAKTVTSDVKTIGNYIYLIGETKPEMGGSAYYKHLGYLGASAPQVNVQLALNTFRRLHRAIDRGLVASCHDLSEGGLGVALAEMCFGGNLGMNINLEKVPGAKQLKRPDYLLYSESNSRFLVEVAPKNQALFKHLMQSVPFGCIGQSVIERKLTLSHHGKTLMKAAIKPLKNAWQKTFNQYF